MTPPAYEAFLDKQLTGKWAVMPNEANAIRELLAGKIDAAQAAIGFTSMINSANNKKNAEGGLWRLWGLLANVAGHFEEEEWQNKLVDMVEAITQLPDLVIANQTAVQWSELQSLGDVWTETIFNRGEDTKLTQRINETVFTAKLTRIPAADFHGQAGFAMWWAFEKSPETEAEVDTAAVRVMNVRVSIALAWILNAGEHIFNSNLVFDGNGQAGLWKGPPGFSHARWEFWKKRASWVADLGMLGKDARDAARQIETMMGDIEERNLLARYAQ